MSIPEICALPVKDIAEDNSVLFMWVTMPMLEVGFEVIKAWGFKYKTCAFTWVKTNQDGSIYMGMGRHTRGNAELCLLATRGKGLQRINAGIYNTQLYRRGKHSKKPDKFREYIEQLYGEKTRIELFARNDGQKDLFNKNPLDGWDTFGNQTVNSISLVSQSQ